jgi:threonine synthase
MMKEAAPKPFLQCILCGRKYDVNQLNYFCEHCVDQHEKHYGNMEISYEPDGQNSLLFPLQPFRIFEGNTPLVGVDSLNKTYGFRNLYCKCEMTNPTASFKDRATSYMIAQAIKLSKTDVVASSSGNAGVSLAAYALKAGIKCHIFVPERTSKEKVELIRLLKASVVYVDGTFEDSYYASLGSRVQGAYSCHAGSNPFAMEAYKKTALEIFEKIGVPDKIVVPVGDGTHLSGIWKGFRELRQLGISKKSPKMIAVQVKGADPVTIAHEQGISKYIVKNPVESVAEGIVASESYNSLFTTKALKESDGFPISVTDKEIVRNLQISVGNGLIIEPTSAAALAAVERMRKEDRVENDEIIVCMLTGSGIKTISEITTAIRTR